MADGEKRKFGNFAEYAKARQAGKLPVDQGFQQGLEGGGDQYNHYQDQQMPGMSGPGNSDQSRFMQSFSSAQTGQAPSNMLNMGMQQQGMQQQQQRNQMGGAPGMSGLGGSTGNMQQQMGRGPLGMSLGMQGGGVQSGLGLGRTQAGQTQSGQQGGLNMQQRVPMQGGGSSMGPLGAGISRPNNIGQQQAGQPGYSDAGEILAMLNKGGMGGSGINGGASGQGLGGLPPGINRGNGLQGLAPGGQGPVGTGAGVGGGPEGSLSGLSSQTEFSMEEDFPALPGASSGQGPNNSLMSGAGSGNHGIVEQFQRMKMEGQRMKMEGGGGAGEEASGMGAPAGQGGGSSEKPDRFGMLGLLNVIRMVDENLTLVALGTDLTSLGLNLNASENLHETFVSPFVNNSASRTPEYNLPRCYYISPPALKTVFFQKFCDMTLFYIFYHFLTRPSDAPHLELRTSLVKYAYQELVSRGWHHQQEGNLWLKRAETNNQVMYFDLNSMELRPFVPGQTGTGSSSPATGGGGGGGGGKAAGEPH